MKWFKRKPTPLQIKMGLIEDNINALNSAFMEADTDPDVDQYARISVDAMRKDIDHMRESHGKTLYKLRAGLKDMFMWRKDQDEITADVASAMTALLTRLTNLETAMRGADDFVGEQRERNVAIDHQINFLMNLPRNEVEGK